MYHSDTNIKTVQIDSKANRICFFYFFVFSLDKYFKKPSFSEGELNPKIITGPN